jgi:hypothetical protein
MKFLRVGGTLINTRNITQIFIGIGNKSHSIIIFYEGFNFSQDTKTKQVAIYKEDIATYEEAEAVLNELLEQLNA